MFQLFAEPKHNFNSCFLLILTTFEAPSGHSGGTFEFGGAAGSPHGHWGAVRPRSEDLAPGGNLAANGCLEG